MDDEQYERYRKMRNDPPKILFKMTDKKGNIHFLVQGNNRYKVSILPQGIITCTCPDMKYNGIVEKKKMLCKHCLAIVDHLGFKNVNHTFFKRNFFTPDEISEIKKNKSI